MNKIEGVGPNDAKIFILGEAPGETEEKEGKPFVGQSGRILDGLLEESGIRREDCYITNVYKFRPANNDFSTIDKGELAKAYAEVGEELARVRPHVTVLLGNEAMRAVLGYAGVSDWRGSVLETKFGKVIPTYHPAAIAREWKFRPLSAVDWGKVAREQGYREVRKEARNLAVCRTLEGVERCINFIITHKFKVSFDVETETNQICCIAFSTTAHDAVCIPFWFGASGSFWSPEEETRIWQWIKKLLEDEEVPKIAQNAQYDMTILKDIYGIEVKGLWLDTMLGFHALYPELPKALSTLTSLYTDVNYYKFLRKTDEMEKFFGYNAMDACVTFECAEKIEAEMEEFGVKAFYYEHIHSLIEPLMSITRTGVRIDSQKKKEAAKAVEGEIEGAQVKLGQQVGHELNVNSPKQMKKWLYEELKLPVQYKKNKGKAKTISCDEEALESLHKLSKHEGIKTVLEIRERRKLLSTYLEVNYDKEKEVLLHEDEATGQIIQTGERVVERARTAYLISGTETGRLSSRETVYRTGSNLQNVPKGIARRIFIPDQGKVFVNADLSQAEARVVAYLAGEDRLIQVFNSGGDIHRQNAANIFRKKLEEVSSQEREIAKRVVHASNYGMGPVTFARQAGVSVAEAKQLLNQYFAEYPRIKLWHMQVASQLRGTRTITTPLGRKRTFFNMYNESLIKEALAYVPQSTVADVLNWGLRRAYEKFKGTGTDILLQIHDAILCQTPEERVQETSEVLRESLKLPVLVRGRELTIPVDISVGENWDEMVKLKG